MKLRGLLPAVALGFALVLLASCGSGRGYQYESRPRYENARVSLIISPSPGFTMSRSADGRFYHRSAQGFIYWQGNDNRFYLDKADIHRVHYNSYEYREWQRYGRQYSKRVRRY